MKRVLCCLAVAVCAAVPASAQDRGVGVSLGYAFAAYLEEGGGNAPVGAYLSIASTRPGLGFEIDGAWHRDSEDFFGDTIVLNTITGMVGPRIGLGTGDVRPFLHVLGGIRYDKIEDESNTAWGGMAGGGVDVPIGSSVSLRLGADFQMFFDAGDNVKTLRLNAGFTF